MASPLLLWLVVATAVDDDHDSDDPDDTDDHGDADDHGENRDGVKVSQ